ncbi:MAG: threonylcarbamoyl-AMP synthase [Coxiella sp. (in: Bacteria)]|nr:MAG: threonylcarbamoyl-AMP synthase [Coxiella sp. (in: g-proteobacteria)]
MTHSADIIAAVKTLRDGGIIAYPTEAVYGLGCDPFNSPAVFKLLGVKRRQPEKGLILVASNWEQIENLIQPIAPPSLAHVQETWPGPNTWLFPASGLVPSWIKGQHDTVALRISAHPDVIALCNQFGGPIVSTSANIEGHPAKRDFRTAQIAFKHSVDFILNGSVGGAHHPTYIRDAVTNDIIRKGN